MHPKSGKNTSNICRPEKLKKEQGSQCVYSALGVSSFCFIIPCPQLPPSGDFVPLVSRFLSPLSAITLSSFVLDFLKSYLRNFGVAPDSAALMVIERGIQTELKCSST